MPYRGNKERLMSQSTPSQLTRAATTQPVKQPGINHPPCNTTQHPYLASYPERCPALLIGHIHSRTIFEEQLSGGLMSMLWMECGWWSPPMAKVWAYFHCFRSPSPTTPQPLECHNGVVCAGCQKECSPCKFQNVATCLQFWLHPA